MNYTCTLSICISTGSFKKTTTLVLNDVLSITKAFCIFFSECGRIVEVEHPTLVRDTENLLEHAMWWKDFSPSVNSTTVWSMDDLDSTKPRKVRKRGRKKRNARNKVSDKDHLVSSRLDLKR